MADLVKDLSRSNDLADLLEENVIREILILP